MHLLVTGSTGLLGSQVIASAPDRGWAVSGTYHDEEPSADIDAHRLDVRRDGRIAPLLERLEPDAVVNCAAMIDVDACERDPAAAHAVNGRAPGDLAAACSARDIGLVHVSTDYVFDGVADAPYEETDEPAPMQVYGESKLAGERAVRAAHDSALVVRLSFLYGLHGDTGELAGFPAWVREQLSGAGETALFTDQRVTPTRSGQAATVILELLDRASSGTYHVACRSCVSPRAFGEAVRERLGSPAGDLVDASMAEVDRPAPRPAYTCLDVSKLEAALGRAQPTLDEDLDAIAAAL